jgi:hypothetical protein
LRIAPRLAGARRGVPGRVANCLAPGPGAPYSTRMDVRPGRGSALRAGLALTLLAIGLHDGAVAAPPSVSAKRRPGYSAEPSRPPGASPRPAVRTPRWRRPVPVHPAPRAETSRPKTPGAEAPRAETPPRAYLIYLVDGGEPIVVSHYVEEDGQIAFEKYGGWVRIPTYDILRVVPDTPDSAERTANLPPPRVDPDTGNAPLRPEANLFVTMRGGGNLRVQTLRPEGDRVRVAMTDGSFTVPRSEIVSVVRVPPGSEAPEAWLSIVATDAPDGAAPRPTGLTPPAANLPFPYPSSERPHYLRLANGQLVRVDGFWVEDGEFRFRRLGGVVGIALDEVLRVFASELAPVPGRTAVRFVRRLRPDLIEVGVRSGPHRVRLLGIEPVAGPGEAGEDPWRHLERGATVHLEFDRQRYDADGNWLAYVFLPGGRMLNAELVRVGMARPLADGRNARYLDLLHEVSIGGVPDGPDATDGPAEADSP